MNIAWAITGAGCYLRESVESMEKIAKNNKVTVFLSKSGEEVIKAYGLWERLAKIAPGDYLQEIFSEHEQGASSPSAGRFFLKRYDALVVSPATTNTVAKIAHGISDTLVTNAVSNAMKSRVPVYVCPSDRIIKDTRVLLPCYIDRITCRKCSRCLPVINCEQKAIENYSINLLKCNSCGACIAACEYGAVVGGKKVKMRVRKIDHDNVKRIENMEFIKIIKNPGKIQKLLLGNC
ncbi:MAG: dihydromethanopterin reductase (acceptor) [Candidatus Hydrothermarchaeaceae archaeon]